MISLKTLFKKRENEERSIILDTCALESEKVFDIIDMNSKVILLTGTLDEMDNKKLEKERKGKGNDTFLYNLRELARRSRKDEYSEKYICMPGYDKYDYNDKNIVDYCKSHRNTTIVTGDNLLCSHAKAYNIPYIFLEGNKAEVNTEIIQEESSIEDKESKPRETIKEIIYKTGTLYIYRQNKNQKVFLCREGVVIDNIIGKMIMLKKGDIIYRLKSTSRGIKFTEYEIQEISENNYAFCKRRETIKKCSDMTLKLNDVPKEIKDVINSLFPNDTLKVEVKEDISSKIPEEKQEVFFSKNWINVKHPKGYYTEVKLLRNGNLIDIKNYQEGDCIYVLSYNKSNKYINIIEYKIMLQDNKYSAQKIRKEIVYYINEIYQLKFSEQLQEEIRKLLVSYTKY